MAEPKDIDGVLVQWGGRLFYTGNKVVKDRRETRLVARLLRDRATTIRARIEATVVRRAPQVMVKVTGGGRGMKAIAAHLRYINKNGRLDVEDELGSVERGTSAVKVIAEDWRFGGSYIGDTSDRREAFNVMLSMPHGTDPLIVQRAAREFARIELADNKYVMVLHDHQANPNVHISVRAESKHGERLNPRKADLQRWRKTFAERLRAWGVGAEATRQATPGVGRNYRPLWRVKAKGEGRERSDFAEHRKCIRPTASRSNASAAWANLAQALATSGDCADRRLADAIQRSKNLASRQASMVITPRSDQHA